jgi:hypothetical protein
VEEDTVAVLVSELPGATFCTRTEKLKVADASAAREGSVQVNGSPVPQLKPPPPGVPTRLTPSGRSSLTDTFWAAAGPAFDTVTEQLITAPGALGPGSQVLVIDRSASGSVVVVVDVLVDVLVDVEVLDEVLVGAVVVVVVAPSVVVVCPGMVVVDAVTATPQVEEAMITSPSAVGPRR